MEIKIIPYEDRKNICSEYNPTYESWTDEKIKLHIIEISAKEVDTYGNLKKLIEIVDNLKIKEYRENKIAIQLGKFNFENLM
ncbi:hypothetical protein [Flavobacterium cerinum]|uniref:Uncharacterized protein n=1 Tax=Flavobacterium cerinum TaxID=2502784 RepID=A0A3S3U3B1_9FLAO|nr:hypothetical protein [Flavobacterium cerinum]RWX00887.1 hypothetical protein EPI11_07645 [Flavobacterium cerinum]